MKTISTTAIVALMTVSVGLAAAAPAMAQEGHGRIHQHQQQGNGPDQHGQRPGNDGPGRGGMLGGLLDFGRDSERLEVSLVRLAHRIDLTDEQKTLLETFKTAALAAQSDFSDVLDAARPTGGTAPTERPDVVARLNQRIALEKAHVDALTAVQPSFEAFIGSLTDAQKAELMPQRNQRTGWQGQNNHQGPMGPHGKRPMPGQADELDGAGTPADAPIQAAPAPAQING
jgi:hypothetical protein